MTALEFLQSLQLSKTAWEIIFLSVVFGRFTKEGLMIIGMLIIAHEIMKWWK